MNLLQKWFQRNREPNNEICPGSGSVFNGKYRRTRCSTSNGLERHLPGDFQHSIRYFAPCPGCKIERAITKGNKKFVRHTRSDQYHPTAHPATVAYAKTFEKPLEFNTPPEGDVRNSPVFQKQPPDTRGYIPLVVIGRCTSCDKEIIIIDPMWEKLEEFRESSPTGPGERWYCNCIGDPFSLVEKKSTMPKT
jgi:hypothetical protein